MSRSSKKANRLLQIEALLLAYPEGLTPVEIARKLQVNRSTIGRYLNQGDLPGHIYLDDLDGGKWKIDREGYLVNVRFNLHEALAVHLAARLLATRLDRQNPHAAAALRKLGVSLERLAPQISQHVKQAADLADAAARFQDPRYVQVLEKLALAWAERRKVRVWHRHEKTDAVYQYVFAPYFIEPYAVGHTTHVIGWREPPGELRTFKIERIERIEEIKNPPQFYEIPDNFDPRQLLADAWGIWYTETEPQEVTLRFSSQVAHRVQETLWHGSQKLAMLPDGRLLWQAKVAEPKEMLHWIRGWGGDVEVVGPDWLRRRLISASEQLGELYQIRPPAERQPYQWLYAKTDRKNPDNIHLLLYHLIDVGQVALAMWHDAFPDSFKNQITEQLNLPVETAGRFVAFIASLHDLGKASPAYQKKYSPNWLKEKLTSAGFVLDDPRNYSPETNDPKTSHAYITAWALPPLLVEYCQLDEQFSHKIGQALGGHHGAWPFNSVNFNFDDSACPEWNVARRELVWELRSVFQPPAVARPPTDDVTLNTFLTLLSGFVSVADWLGSRDGDDSFPLVKEVMTTREYAERSQAQAGHVLQDLGWTGWQANHQTLDFKEMFRYLDAEKGIEPRPVQQEIIDLTADLSAPSLIIIEAPTGIGKTEIAFYLADTLLQKHRGRGLYIAMPTQATSNQMFDRAADFLRQRYPTDKVNAHLAHGQAAFDERVQAITLRTIGDDKQGDPIVAMSWFNQYSKRTLLAPFGVGTVDQTLMSVLQTKHFFVRLLGLSHKVVIFDEVHAYDTYMSTLFEQLLQWLRAIGASVIMLSATLPTETRQKFVHAYTGKQPQLKSHYPAITVASADKEPEIYKLPEPENITLEIEWKTAEEQLDHILALAQKGGCIAVICNTVGRSQAIFRQLLEARELGKLEIERENLILFHARFPPIWRKEIEEKTKRLFGKPQQKNGVEKDYRPRPGPAIIVATQVIEQSLDLDFDAMITDLTPIDLLIQRAGRLHRHEIRNAQRHNHVRRLTIVKPQLDDQQIPHFGSDEYIYERYILLRTYRALEKLASDNCITLPAQTVDLIEAVYRSGDPFGDDDPNWSGALREAYQKMLHERHESRQKARGQLAGAPDDGMLLYDTNLGLEEDNPAVHQTFQAKTRDIGPTLSLICLYATDQEDRVALDPEDGSAVIDLNTSPDSTLVEALLQRRINVQHWALLKHFFGENPPPDSAPSAWRENSVLRHTRAVIFRDGVYRFADGKRDFVLSVDHDYGLELKYQLKEV